MEFSKDTIEIKELEVFWKELFQARNIQSLTSAQFELFFKPFRESFEQIRTNVKYLKGDGIVADVKIDRHEKTEFKRFDDSRYVGIQITIETFPITRYCASKVENRLLITFYKNLDINNPNTEVEVQKALQIKKGSTYSFYGKIAGGWKGIDESDVQLGDITESIWIYDINSVPKKSVQQLEDEDKENKKSNCFIATAAFGNHDKPEVIALRNYRDNVLLTTTRGRFIIKSYYLISPPIANLIRHSDYLKWGTRLIIRSLILKKIDNSKT